MNVECRKIYSMKRRKMTKTAGKWRNNIVRSIFIKMPSISTKIALYETSNHAFNALCIISLWFAFFPYQISLYSGEFFFRSCCSEAKYILQHITSEMDGIAHKIIFTRTTNNLINN